MLIGLIVLGTLVVIGLWGLGVYNGLVARRAKVDEAWSGIDVQLKRRHDLIPNLVETVKGYASHERTTLENVISARNSAVSAQESGDIAGTATAEGLLTGALRQVFALSEAYPDLKANQGFTDLHGQLADTEDKISASRRIYNGNVREYNTRIQQVPFNVVAKLGGFTEREFFEIDDPAERAVPAVSFS